MGSANRHEHEEAPAAGDVAASGIRVDRERETTPAPPSASQPLAALPSSRPTSVPDFDVSAHALESSLRHAPLPRLPLDVAIPARTYRAAPEDLDIRAAFLLLHVDGRASVRDIAELTTIPVDEVLAAFFDLSSAGLVSLSGGDVIGDPRSA